MPKHVNKYGRALSPGKVTRRSLMQRRVPRGCGDKPLPIHLQCHPKELTPTPRNPGCGTWQKYWGMAQQLNIEELIAGRGIGSFGRYHVVSFINSKRGKIIGRTDDPNWAFACVKAAAQHGLCFEMIDSEAT